jgi:hypothetical protein
MKKAQRLGAALAVAVTLWGTGIWETVATETTAEVKQDSSLNMEVAPVAVQSAEQDGVNGEQANARLSEELAQKTAAIKALTESLVIAQTEAEMFRQQYEEQRLKLQMIGGQVSSGNADLEKQLISALRSLERSEAEREQLRSQLKRTIEIAEALLPARTEGAEAAKVREMIVAELGAAKRLAASTSDKSATAARPTEGSLENAQVMRVNSELQLAVLDVGRAQGVQLGMQFVAVRGDRVIAQLRVVEVRDNICGAMIAEQARALEAGDRAQVQRGRF